MGELSNNLDIHSTSYEEVKSEKVGGLKGTLSYVNSKLKGLKLEMPQLKEQETLSNIYKNKDFIGALERGVFSKGIDVRYINDNLFGVYSKNNGKISFFSNALGELVLNVSYRESYFIDEEGEYLESSLKAFEEAGFFMDSKSGKRNIYKILGKDKNGEFILKDKPLNKNSIDYFNALKEISKNYDIILLLISIKNKIEIGKGNIDDFTLSGALSMKFLLLLQEKGLLKSSELFKYGIIKMGIKESDILYAFESKKISKEQALMIYKILPDNMKDI